MALPGIYYQPPPPFVGGRQPHEQRKLNPALLDNPPSPFLPNNNKFYAEFLARLSQPPPPWPQQGMRSFAPTVPSGDSPPALKGGPVWVYDDDALGWLYASQRKLNPAFLSLPTDNPPFSHPGRLAVTAQIIMQSQPPAPNPFMGGRQPLATRKLNPAAISITPDNPPIVHPGRRPLYQLEIVYAWQPPPPMPTQGRRLNPTVMNIPTDNPPFAHGGRKPTTQAIVAYAWQPGAPWPRPQRKLSPSVISPTDNPPFSHQGRDPVTLAIIAAGWAPLPPMPYFPRPTPPVTPPTPPPTGVARGRRRLFRRN